MRLETLILKQQQQLEQGSYIKQGIQQMSLSLEKSNEVLKDFNTKTSFEHITN